jgi:hypothetical protein
MGLIQEVQTLNDTNKQLQNEYIKARKEAEKATREAKKLEKKLEYARQEKEQKREYERDIKKAIEKDFIKDLQTYINKNNYKKSFIDLYTIETRTNIINKFAKNDFEFDYINENYERILNKVKKIYENDQNAKNELLTQQLKEELQKSGNIEIAKKFGYDENKIYTIEGINKLNDNIKAYIEQQEQQEKENATNIFIAFFRFIGLIIKWFFLILFGGLYLIIKVLTGLAK